MKEGNISPLRSAAADLEDPMFWGSFALFSGVATAAEAGLARLSFAPVRTGLSMGAGMAAVQALHGQVSPARLAVSVASYSVSGASVGFLLDRLLPALLGPAPVRGFAGILMGMFKYGLALYVGEELETWILGSTARNLRRPGETGPGRSGIRDALDELNRQ